MKKILYYIAISVICALPFNSCTLDEETSTDVEKKNFMRDDKEAEIVLQGVYRSTIEDGQQRHQPPRQRQPLRQVYR